MKFIPGAIVSAHRRTYVDARNGLPLMRDFFWFEIAPFEVGLASFMMGAQVTPAAAAALLTVSALLGALLFGAMLQISQRAMDWSDTRPTRGPATSAHADFLIQLAANSGYASLICILAAGTYLADTIASGLFLTIASAASIALTLHLTLVLLMVMRRVFALTQERLNRARTGADTDAPGQHRRAG